LRREQLLTWWRRGAKLRTLKISLCSVAKLHDTTDEKYIWTERDELDHPIILTCDIIHKQIYGMAHRRGPRETIHQSIIGFSGGGERSGVEKTEREWEA